MKGILVRGAASGLRGPFGSIFIPHVICIWNYPRVSAVRVKTTNNRQSHHQNDSTALAERGTFGMPDNRTFLDSPRPNHDIPKGFLRVVYTRPLP